MASATAAATLPRAGGFQFRLATLLIAMVWLGIACAALASPTRFWAGVVFALAIFSLLTSVLLIVHRRGAERAFAIGFFVFGAGYLTCLLVIDHQVATDLFVSKIPTTHAISWLYMQTHAKITRLSPGGGMSMGTIGGMPAMFGVREPLYTYQAFCAVAQYDLIVLIGLAGGVISRFLYLTRPDFDRGSEPQPESLGDGE